MIHILLCCGGGFSSSALAAKVKKDIQQYQLEDQFEIEFSPFMIAQGKNGPVRYRRLLPAPDL